MSNTPLTDAAKHAYIERALPVTNTRLTLTHNQMANRLRSLAEVAGDNYFRVLASELREMADDLEDNTPRT